MGGQLIVRIGRKIRETRLRQQMKLQEVAGSAGISKGLLSRIENGRTVPSLPVLLSLIRALKVPVEAFFEGIDVTPPAPYVHRKAIEYASLGKEGAAGLLSEHILSQNVLNVALEASILTLQPGTRQEPVTSDGYEFKYVLSGEVEYRLGDDTVLLETGDSLFFNGQIPHVPVNRTTQPASLLVIYLLSAQG
jgi:transcriptional regulator with XRE-family HTH domain